ncbi:MAG: hypothetical protein ACYCTV_10760 [Leptospirales bacterium]
MAVPSPYPGLLHPTDRMIQHIVNKEHGATRAIRNRLAASGLSPSGRSYSGEPIVSDISVTPGSQNDTGCFGSIQFIRDCLCPGLIVECFQYESILLTS